MDKARLRKMTPQARAGYYRSVEAQKRIYKEFLERQEEEERQKTEEAEKTIDSIISAMWDVVNKSSTRFVANGMKETLKIVSSLIDEAIDTWGVVDTAEALKIWSPDFRKKIENLVMAVIDTKRAGRYNTNTNVFKKDKDGNIGRARFRRDLEKLAKALKVSSRLLDAKLEELLGEEQKEE